MTKAVVENVNNVLKYREKIFTFLIIGIFISLFSYVYLLHQAIANVVIREGVLKENRALSTSVSELEAKYFIIKNTINIELAHAKGFKDSDISSFISKKSLTAMVNKNEL